MGREEELRIEGLRVATDEVTLLNWRKEFEISSILGDGVMSIDKALNDLIQNVRANGGGPAPAQRTLGARQFRSANPVDSDGIQSRDITGPVDAFKWKIEEHQTASLLYTVHDTTVGISGVSRTDIVKQLCPS